MSDQTITLFIVIDIGDAEIQEIHPTQEDADAAARMYQNAYDMQVVEFDLNIKDFPVIGEE